MDGQMLTAQELFWKFLFFLNEGLKGLLEFERYWTGWISFKKLEFSQGLSAWGRLWSLLDVFEGGGGSS